MLGIDAKLAGKEERSRLRKEKEESRRSKHVQTSQMQQSREYFKFIAPINFNFILIEMLCFRQ